MAEVRSFNASRVLLIVAVVLALAAGVVGFGWLAPDNAKDAADWYEGLLAFAVAAGFGSFLV